MSSQVGGCHRKETQASWFNGGKRGPGFLPMAWPPAPWPLPAGPLRAPLNSPVSCSAGLDDPQSLGLWTPRQQDPGKEDGPWS